MQSALADLRDVDGIVGSFVYAERRAVLARDLSPLFDDTALEEAGERVLRVFAAMDEPEWALLDFSAHRLFIRRVDTAYLCVLTEGTVNVPALRMGASLVGRRVAREMAQVASSRPTLPSAPSYDSLPLLDDDEAIEIEDLPPVDDSPRFEAGFEPEPEEPQSGASPTLRAPPPMASMSPEARAQLGRPASEGRRIRIFRGKRYEV